MNSERPHDIRSWEQLSDGEKSRYFLLSDEDLAIVKPMTEDERAEWFERTRRKALMDLIPPKSAGLKGAR